MSLSYWLKTSIPLSQKNEAGIGRGKEICIFMSQCLWFFSACRWKLRGMQCNKPGEERAQSWSCRQENLRQKLSSLYKSAVVSPVRGNEKQTAHEKTSGWWHRTKNESERLSWLRRALSCSCQCVAESAALCLLWVCWDPQSSDEVSMDACNWILIPLFSRVWVGSFSSCDSIWSINPWEIITLQHLQSPPELPIFPSIDYSFKKPFNLYSCFMLHLYWCI